MRSVNGKRVVVVGGAGFLGSHAVEHLIQDRSCTVLVIDNLVAGRREFIHKDAEFFHHDITGSEHFLCSLLKNWKADFLMNWSAWPYVPNSFSRPLHVFDVNCFGAIKVINAAQEAGVEGILQVSSAEVYGECRKEATKYDGRNEPCEYKPAPITEEDRVIPHSSYGASKAAVDAYCQVTWKERKTPVIALRQFNAMGERDVLHPYVVTTIIQQLLPQRGNKSAVVKLGTNTSRDFMYAGDAIKVSVMLLERGEFGAVYNSGSEVSIKVYDLATMVGWVMGLDVEVEFDESRVRPWDIYHLRSCNDKINAVIGPFNRMPLEETIRRTVRWFEENP